MHRIGGRATDAVRELFRSLDRGPQVLLASCIYALGATVRRGRWLATGTFLLKVLVLNLAGLACLGLGLLVSVPVSILAAGSYFLSLLDEGA